MKSAPISDHGTQNALGDLEWFDTTMYIVYTISSMFSSQLLKDNLLEI